MRKSTALQKLGRSTFILVLLAFLTYPLLRLLVVPYFSENFSEYWNRLFESSSIAKSLRMTLYFSSAVTILSVVIGVFWAWVLTRTDFPFKKTFRTWTSLPYAIPPFIGAISWIYLANPSNGLLNQITGPGFLNIYSLTGLVFVETSFLYTFVFLAACSALDLMDSSFEEAARTSGATPVQTFFKITLPLIFPSILNSAILVFLAAVASFGVPALIASPAGFKVMTTEIYQLQKIGTMSGLQTSILLSSLLLLFSVVVILISQSLAQGQKMAMVTGKTAKPSLIKLKKLKIFFIAMMIFFLSVVLVLPFLGVLFSATSQVQGSFSFDNFTLNHFHRILFETEELGRAFKNSLIIASSVGFICGVLALILGYLQTQTNIRGKTWIEIFVALPYSAPGTVIALALIISFSQHFFGVSFSIYNTLWMFIIAFVLRYLNFSFKIVTDNYRQIHQHLIEAAQTSGASFLKIIYLIWIPLLRPSLIAAFFLVFVPSLSELTMSIFLTGPGLETIGTLIFQMQEYSDNIGGGAAVLSTFIFVFVIFMNSVVKFFSKGKYGL